MDKFVYIALQVQQHIENEQKFESDDEQQWSMPSQQLNNANNIAQTTNFAPLMMQTLEGSPSFSMTNTSNATVRLTHSPIALDAMQQQSTGQEENE